MRLYEMFIGDFEKAAPWKTDSIKGCRRFIERVCAMADNVAPGDEYSKKNEGAMHRTIKKVSEDIENLKFNTAIAALMSLLNIFSENGVNKAEFMTFLVLLNPFAPHITEELAESFGVKDTLVRYPWPKYDESKTVEESVNIAVQVNGKLKGVVVLPLDCDEEQEKKAALEDEKVKAFVGEYTPENYLLKHENPLAVGPYGVSAYYMEAKMAQAQAMVNAKQVILDVGRSYAELTGRYYGLFESYCMEDAEEAVVLIGSSAGTARVCVDQLRDAGRKVGMIKVRVYRPFPGEELAEALQNVRAVAVLDKCESYSTHGGPLGTELRSALYDAGLHPLLINYVYGLGGRDFAVTDCAAVFDALDKALETGSAKPIYRHLGQRGGDLRGV